MKILSAAVATAMLAGPAMAAPAPHAGWADFRALFEEMVNVDSTVATGSCAPIVEKTRARMIAAGFPAGQLFAFAPAEDARAANLVAVYPGTDPKAKAVLMLGHIDEVNARREDWTRDPFTLVEEDGQFYARGVSDMKAQDAIWADTLIRFHKEGYRPRRTVKMALTCGEEGGFINGANWLAQNQRQLIDAGFALTEGGGGDLAADGRKLAVTVMDQEKESANYILEVTNAGGHSSRPRRDNAIYTLAHAIDRVEALEFPVVFNRSNRAYFTGMAGVVGGEDGAAMTALLANPDDRAAAETLKRTPAYRAMLGTTCIPVLLEGGHAGNAQPQRASVNINCRMLPGTAASEVAAALEAAVADPKVKLTSQARPGGKLPGSPLTEQIMGPIRKAAAKVYPGLPVVPMQETFGTDSARLIAVGIPSYGVSGLFRGLDGGNIHGLNEHISVQSVKEGRDFLYLLVKGYAAQK